MRYVTITGVLLVDIITLLFVFLTNGSALMIQQYPKLQILINSLLPTHIYSFTEKERKITNHVMSLKNKDKIIDCPSYFKPNKYIIYKIYNIWTSIPGLL